MSKELQKRTEELAELIRRHTKQKGINATSIPSLSLIHRIRLTEPAYRVYNLSFCFIVHGRKEIFLADERFEYGPANYLISSMRLPIIGQVVKASPEAPYLSLKLEFTHNEVLEVLNDSQMQFHWNEQPKRALFVGQMEASILDAVLRFVRLLDHPADISFLAPYYKKEIIYRLLQDQYGDSLAQIAFEGSNAYRIRDVIEQVIANYDKPMRVEELAMSTGMSVSSFHKHFKEITAMSPLQFQKQLRLQEARRFMLAESADASEIAYRVGYESASQFSREYARMFGAPPKADIKRLKEQLAQ